jgi:hypothetical protein
MESTSNYSVPLFQILECAGFDVVLCNSLPTHPSHRVGMVLFLRRPMSRVFSTIALLALALPSFSLGEWYSIRGEPTTTIRIQDNGKSIRVPVRKFDPGVTDLILRPDAEDAKRYWVEVTLVQWLDSGSGYFLAFGDVVLGEIYT